MKTYTVKEIAEMYDAALITVYTWIYRGLLTAKKTKPVGRGGYILYITEDELERFMTIHPTLRWKLGNVTCEIDDITRERLAILYDLRFGLDKEIHKYESILSAINDEETF